MGTQYWDGPERWVIVPEMSVYGREGSVGSWVNPGLAPVSQRYSLCRNAHKRSQTSSRPCSVHHFSQVEPVSLFHSVAHLNSYFQLWTPKLPVYSTTEDRPNDKRPWMTQASRRLLPTYPPGETRYSPRPTQRYRCFLYASCSFLFSPLFFRWLCPLTRSTHSPFFTVTPRYHLLAHHRYP